MANVFRRIGDVVKSEWNHRFKDGEEPPVDAAARAEVDAVVARADARPAGPSVSDVDSALRVLELPGLTTLDEVRAQYRVLAHRYHPRTTSSVADQRNAAHTVLLALTDALELLEEHLLPLPPGSGPAPAR